MSEKARPSGWYYSVATLLPVLGCLIAMVLVYQWFLGLPGTFESKPTQPECGQEGAALRSRCDLPPVAAPSLPSRKATESL